MQRNEPSSRTRPGFSVVEVMVALMLVAVGLLGVAGTSALSLRTATSAVREREALQRAATRLAILSAAGCHGAETGALDASGRAGGMRESWAVSAPIVGFARVDARVDWVSAGRAHSLRLESAFAC